MATLVARRGDVQALKCLIAAGYGGDAPALVDAPDTECVRGKASNPFGTNTIALTTAGGINLTEANAIAKLLGTAQWPMRRSRPA